MGVVGHVICLEADYAIFLLCIGRKPAGIVHKSIKCSYTRMYFSQITRNKVLYEMYIHSITSHPCTNNQNVVKILFFTIFRLFGSSSLI